MPERDYGLGGTEAREAYDSAKARVKSKPTVRPKARPQKNDPPPVRPRARPIEEAETISVKESDTDALVGMWDAVTGDFTPSEESSLGREVIRQIEKDAPKDSPSIKLPSKPSLNLGPASLSEKGISLDWANVFEGLLKDKLPNNVRVNKLKSSWDGGDTIKLLDANFTFAEGGKVSDQAQTEMELIMNEQKDPVSGNTAPIGAKPSEVRDDIDIRVSENEFVVNAQTVRYFGEDFFNELQKAAAEGFERIKEGDELPFRDDELDVEEEEMPQGFAEGGVVPEPVGGGYGQYGGTGSMFSGFQSKQYINDNTKQKITVFFFNGRPLSRIPEGFREMGETVTEEQQEAEAAQEVRSPADDRNAMALEEIRASSTDHVGKPVQQWNEGQFQNYYVDIRNDIKAGKDPLGLSKGEKLVSDLLGGGLLGTVLGGGNNLVEQLILKAKKDKAEKVFKHISELETATGNQRDLQYTLGSALGVAGYDPTVANPYTKDELDEYGFPTQEGMDRVGVKSGLLDFDLITKTKDDIGLLGDVEKYYELGGVRPRGRPAGEVDEEGKYIFDDKPRAKYDPTSTSLAGGAKKNLLTEKEQPSFDNAVETGNDTLAAHFVAINRLRNKKESFAEQYASASEKEKARLMGADRVDGLSIQDREQAIASIVTQPEPEEEDEQPENTSSNRDDDGPSVAEQLAEQNRRSREANLPTPRPSDVSNVEDRTSIISESLADKKAREEKEAIKKYKDKVIAGGGTWATGGR